MLRFIAVVVFAGSVTGCSGPGSSTLPGAGGIAGGALGAWGQAHQDLTGPPQQVTPIASRPVVATTTTHDGQIVDWVPQEEVWPGGVAPEAPPPPSSVDAFALSRPSAGLQPDEMGPEGTLPFLHIDPDHPPTAMPPVTGPTYLYVQQFIPLNSLETDGIVNVANPALDPSFPVDHTLAQSGMSAVTSAGKEQTVETGWDVDKNLYGDTQTHWFIFYTTNNYTSEGNCIGGYNTTYLGWIQLASDFYPGKSLAGEIGIDLFIETYYSKGAWWIWLSNVAEWIGYYPAAIAPTSCVNPLFANPGLKYSATNITWHGEVLESGTTTTTTQMGNGIGLYDNSGADYLRDLHYEDLSNIVFNFPIASGYWHITAPGCYNGYLHNSTSWGNYFYFGGPGKNATWCP